jgi:ribonuclease HI
VSSLGQSKRSPGDALNYAARAPLAEDNNATELLAVFVALVRHPRRSPITIRTDSRATLDVLERLARGDGLRAFKFKGARGAASCRATLFWLRAGLFWREAATAVRKVKAHAAATPDNATADALARVGANASAKRVVPYAPTGGGFFRLGGGGGGGGARRYEVALFFEIARFLSGARGEGNGALEDIVDS